jgi:competence protein ComEA
MIVLLAYSLFLAIKLSQPIIDCGSVSPYRVHLQTDPPEYLELLPGIGPKMAERIVAFRKEHVISSPDDLMEIHGIGQKTVDQLRWLTTTTPNNHED